MNKYLFSAVLFLVACNEPRHAIHADAERTWEEGYTPGSFGVTPQCPAPSHPHAESYVQSGGHRSADSAMNWLLMMHAMNALSGPSHVREVHHVYHERPAYQFTRPVVRAVPRVVPSTPPSTPPKSSGVVYKTQTSRPSNSVSVTTNSKSATGVIRKSPSFGFKPSSTSFRASSSSPSRRR